MSSEGGGGRGRRLVGGSDGVRRTTEDAIAVGGTGGTIGGTLDKGIALPPSPDDSFPGSRDPSLEPLKVLVEKGTRNYSDSRSIYPIHSSLRGLALIINNIEFVNDIYPYRKGAHVDSENLEELFKQLGFKVEKYVNLTSNETTRTLMDFTERKEHNEADMVFVCVLSHGREEGRIASSDGLDLNIEVDILRRFNNDFCPALKGKPKFFIFQACRGDERDYGITPAKPRDETDARKTRVKCMSMSEDPPGAKKGLTWEDMLIAFATLPGYVSHRDHFRGTWFIESLCKVVMRRAQDTNLRDMLDMVALELSDYESESGTKQSFSYDVRHFYKKLYFNPGFVSGLREQWKYKTTLVEGRQRAVSESVVQPPGHRTGEQ